MDSSLLGVVKMILATVPVVVKILLLRALGLSDTAHKRNLRTELTVSIIAVLFRAMRSTPVLKAQQQTLRDPGVKGPMWVSKITLTAPEDDAKKLLLRCINEMNESGDEKYTEPGLVPVEAEWTGYRSNVGENTSEPEISEKEKYRSLIKEATSKVTILYFHGGSYYMSDPATYRSTTTRLARKTGGRVLSVRYRLSPQNPFPAALLDAFICYLSLLSPPPGSFHEAVPASEIVVAGDSAGGNLSMALLQFLLQLHRSSGPIPTVLFHGKKVEISLPAGVAVNAPWMDVTHCMPSMETNAKYDFLPPPSFSDSKPFPPDSVWPAKPPRRDLFCEGTALCHSLVSPMAALDWKGSPPVFIVCGEELLEDEDRLMAKRLAKQGVKVVWEQYEGMPHVFGILIGGHPAAEMSVDRWCDNMKRFVETPQDVRTKGAFVTAKLEVLDVDVMQLHDMNDEDAITRMKSLRDKKIRDFEQETKKRV